MTNSLLDNFFGNNQVFFTDFLNGDNTVMQMAKACNIRFF